MSLETVVEDIRKEAQSRAEEIREEGEARADEIIDNAESEAESIKSEASDRAERKIAQEKEQKISSANLEAKQKRLEARRDVLNEVQNDVRKRIAAVDGERRKELTESLLKAAATEFEDVNDVSVYGRGTDEDLIEELVADRDGFSYAGSIDCLGGVVVESESSRVRVNNTFDSVLDEVWEDNLREVSSRLFEE